MLETKLENKLENKLEKKDLEGKDLKNKTQEDK